MSDEVRDLIFYIHGVTPRRDPAPHTTIYKSLNDGIRGFNPHWPTTFHGAEWGWNPGEETSVDQELLSQAQNQLGHRVLPEINNAKDFSLNPSRLAINQLRELSFFGYSDMFYYTSNTGKEAVRAAICKQLYSFVQKQRALDDRPLRLTLVGHSMGGVIAFDLLFHLFHPEVPPYSQHCFVHQSGKDESLHLRALAISGELKLRRLITLGNPLSSMALRHSRVVEAIAAGEKLNPLHYGLVPDETLPGPRWQNLWDLDDPLSWPVAPLMNNDSKVVSDVYVNVSDWISKAHYAYWTSKAAHKAIAERW
ncbi:hypothetical protein P3T73_06090 [Kiritimatiellota bacterium B12222]|nr:hypothetical protein P3T73_06090 [Kiritimatiellota bacterium B12222]